MKTTSEKKTKSELKNRPEPRSTATERQIDFNRRKANRALSTGKVLALLRSESPGFFDLAEVVGQWVWIQFKESQPVAVTRSLAELGFHWNRSRQAWQHPCGIQRDRRSAIDPHQKYRSYFPADRMAVTP